MKKESLLFSILCFMICLSLPLYSQKYKPADEFTAQNPLVIFDLDTLTDVNNLGDAYGAFDADPNDKDASIKTVVVKDTDLHKTGKLFKITYDVDSPKPAFNGLWTKLKTLDLSQFEAVSFSLKGDARKGFSKEFKLEVKDAAKAMFIVVNNITDKWNKYTLYFDDFEGEAQNINLKNIKELVFVFEDSRCNPKEGRYYIDDVAFIPKKGVTVKYSDIVK